MADRCSCADCTESTPIADRLRRHADRVELHELAADDAAEITLTLHGKGDLHINVEYDQ